MSSAKAEIADYSTATRFGGGVKVKHDRRWTRPATRIEALRQIEATYRHNRWGIIEQAANSRTCGLEVKSLIHYTDDELKIILSDMEKFQMIIYED